MFSAGADLKAINAGQAATRSAPAAAASPASSTASAASRSSSPSTGWRRPADARSCSPSDLVVATTRSAFGLAEVKRNLIAGAGGLFRLPRAIGQAAAMEAILTGEPIPAQRAYDLGLGLATGRARRRPSTRRSGSPTRSSPTPRSRCWASRKVVLAAAYADDETLKQMTNDEFASRPRIGGHQGRARPRSSRSARPTGPGAERPTASAVESRRHRDQAGGDAGSLVEVLRVAITRERLALEHAGAALAGVRQRRPPATRRRSRARVRPACTKT